MPSMTIWRPDGGASMPVLYIIAVALLTLVAVLREIRSIRDFGTQFLILALWARFILSAMHEQTFTPFLGGLSINAVGSIGITFVALWIAGRQMLLLRYALPLLMLIGLGVVSAALNRSFGGLNEFVMKNLYMLGVALLTFRGIRLNDPQVVLRGLLIATTPLILLQWLSLMNGVVKDSEGDGSVSYIGGYYHEAAFSTAMLLTIFVSSLIRWKSAWTGVAVAAIAVLGIFFANYRTNIIATLPVIGAGLFLGTIKLLPKEMKPIAFIGAALSALVLIMVFPYVVPSRFDDIFHAFDEGMIFLQNPEYFTFAQKGILNYRLFIWSWHFEGWRDGDLLQKVIGYGPAAWQYVFPRYAHNTIISYLFEFGIVGVVVILYVFGYYFYLSMTLPSREDAVRVTACLIGFLLCNMATQPLWGIEGLMIYGVVLGYLWARKHPEFCEAPPIRSGKAAAFSPATP